MNWEDINLKTFKELIALYKSNATNLELISLLANKPAEDLSLEELKDWINEIKFLEEPYKPKEIKSEYNIQNKIYKPVVSLKNIKAGQFIDFQTFIKDPEKNIANIAACFLLEKGKTYGDNDPLEEAEFFDKYLKITDYKDIFNFFTVAWKSYTNSIQAYLEKEMKKTLKKEKNPIMRIKILRAMILMKQTEILESDMN